MEDLKKFHRNTPGFFFLVLFLVQLQPLLLPLDLLELFLDPDRVLLLTCLEKASCHGGGGLVVGQLKTLNY